MTPIKFWVFPRAEVEALFRRSPIPVDALQRWEDARPGVLNDQTQDIFSPNCRTETQRWTAYDLFEQVSNVADADCVVCQNFLELSEAFGVPQNIPLLLNHLIDRFPDKIIVTSWNHDRDAATVNELQSLPPNFIVLQFNTSRPTRQDCLVPFWTIETRIPYCTKQRHAGFRGHIGRVEVRQRLRDACQGKADYVVTDARLNEAQYLMELAETTFALCPRGGGLSSYRVSEAVQCRAIPVIFADDAALPYPWLDWDSFSIRIPEADAGDFHKIDARLRSVDKLFLMQRQLEHVRRHFSALGVQCELFDRLEIALGRI